MADKKHKENQTKEKINFADLQKKAEEYLNGWKRAQADYENLKKQTLLEKEEFAKFANLNLIVSLIPVYNNFKIAVEHLPNSLKDSEWIKGVEHIEQQFKQVLEQNGVKEINPQKGDDFNPEYHEAIQQNSEHSQQETGSKKDKIEKIVSVGYKLKDRVFMPAKVIVA